MDDSIYRLRDRDLLTLCVLALLAMGVIMVHSAAMGLGNTQLWEWSDRGIKHALFAVLSLLTFVTVSRLNYRRLDGRHAFNSLAVWGMVLAFILCAAVLVPGVGSVVNGARRWIVVGPLRIQPSEAAKWATVLFLAWRLSRPGLEKFWSGFVPTCGVVGALCLLVVIEDFGTAALIGVSAFAMLLAGPTKLWHLALTVPPALAAAFAFVAIEPYRWRRMTAFLDPWAAPETDGYHMIQSLYSFATGGLTGRGLGNGVQKLGYLPEDTTDFIFAVICEELGLFGAGLVAVLYLTILCVGWSAAKKAPDPFGRMLCFGVVAMMGLQATINIAVATASVPTKGMSLPLVSAGGSGLILTAVMLGLVYSVCRGPAEYTTEAQSHGEEPEAVTSPRKTKVQKKAPEPVEEEFAEEEEPAELEMDAEEELTDEEQELVDEDEEPAGEVEEPSEGEGRDPDAVAADEDPDEEAGWEGQDDFDADEPETDGEDGKADDSRHAA